MAISGVGIALATAGGILIYSGLENQPVTAVLTSLAHGQKPAPGPAEDYVSGGSAAPDNSVNETAPGSGSATENQTLGKLMAGGYGWYPGPQWDALNSVAMAESGWRANARNPSGAYGIAQALGHGLGSATAGPTGINEYGGYVSDATAKAANSGSAAAQIAWMLAYIKSRWGNPENAWANEQANHWY